MEKCPQVPSVNASAKDKNAYDLWIAANNKAKEYILASTSNIILETNLNPKKLPTKSWRLCKKCLVNNLSKLVIRQLGSI